MVLLVKLTLSFLIVYICIYKYFSKYNLKKKKPNFPDVVLFVYITIFCDYIYFKHLLNKKVKDSHFFPLHLGKSNVYLCLFMEISKDYKRHY